MSDFLVQNVDPKVYAVFKKLAGERIKEVTLNAILLTKDKSVERAMADSLEMYGLTGPVKSKKHV